MRKSDFRRAQETETRIPMTSSGFNFVLKLPHTGREFGDQNWQRIESAYIQTWQAASEILKERQFTSDKGNVTISFDWSAPLRKAQQHFAAMKFLHGKDGKVIPNRVMKARFPRRPAQVSINVHIGKNATEDRTRNENFASNYVELALHDVFLILNIASPSCCNFRGASFDRIRVTSEVSLSPGHFETIQFLEAKHGWPTCNFLDLEKVTSWFGTVRSGVSQVPRNPMERALFALLHLAKIETSPVCVIWLFYALEGLFQTTVGENFSSIVKRLCLILGTNSVQSAYVKRSMRELYNIRSAIVHGGFEVMHPLHNDILDKSVDVSFGKIMDATDSGYAFLLMAIQKTIANGWRFPIFDEIISGDTGN